MLAGIGGVLLVATLIATALETAWHGSNPICSDALSSTPTDTTDSDKAGTLRILGVSPKVEKEAKGDKDAKADKDAKGEKRATGEVQLGSRICVAVAGVAASNNQNRASTVDVTLFLNDQRSPLIFKAKSIPDRQFLAYDLAQPTDASTDAATFWRRIVAGKTWDGTVDLTVGLSRTTSSAPEVAGDAVVKLVVYRWPIVILGAGALLALIIAFAMFAANTAILRDSTSNDATTGLPDGTFSLARTQMALWLVLVTAGFIFLWLTLGLYLHLITAGILVLLGINGATGVAAVAIDGSSTGKTNGFLADITSDSKGETQLHRIQVVGWTVILATIFLWNVAWNFVFVDFDTNLLLLMGIANAMYIGFKHQEK